MHPNPVFHDQTALRNLDFARGRAFGILAVNSDTGPAMAHVPFLIDDDGAYLHLHLVRSNPIARALKAPLSARIAVSGPDGYVSPDWYEAVSYTHMTLPTMLAQCRSRWSPYH